MPYQIKKLSNGKFQVINKITGKVHAKSTTKTKAKKQIKLMEYLDNKLQK